LRTTLKTKKRHFYLVTKSQNPPPPFIAPLALARGAGLKILDGMRIQSSSLQVCDWSLTAEKELRFFKEIPE
jgi:hypothetical protein